ncbi:hypothetical protein F4860DRAFT_380548 [Xylaria cubensis]|nr:hypothetical protein F4860DRAFT_380548 [Xylaria cubensis]
MLSTAPLLQPLKKTRRMFLLPPLLLLFLSMKNNPSYSLWLSLFSMAGLGGEIGGERNDFNSITYPPARCSSAAVGSRRNFCIDTYLACLHCCCHSVNFDDEVSTYVSTCSYVWTLC